MASYQRPGVFVEETLRTKNPEATWSSSTAVFVAAHGRGPTQPTLVKSWSEFARTYGGFPDRTSILPYALFQFFNNGGREAYVLRVTGTGITTASVSLNDRGGTPQETLVVSAANGGAWGNSLYVGIADRGTDLFDLIVYSGGTTAGHIVERHTELSMDPNSPRYVESVVNSIVGGSGYVTVVDSDSTNVGTVGYAGTRPAVTSGTALTGGADGAAPTPTQITASLDLLSTLDRAYVLNLPGVYDTTVIGGALTHAAENGRAFVVIDPPPGVNAAGAVAFADSLAASSYGAVYYPHIHIADPGANSQGATKLVPPGGAVAGIIAQTDTSRGVHKAPAGLSARIAGAVSTELTLSSDDLDTLNAAHVNAIRHAPGAGFVVWGARTLKKTSADKYVPIRRSLSHLRVVLEQSLQWAVFEPNDHNLWESLEANVERFLVGFWQQGGLRGETAEQAFFVRADETINTATSIDAGVVNVEIGVALQYPAEFIIIKLSQWEGGATTVEGPGL